MNIVQVDESKLDAWAGLVMLMFPYLTYDESLNECRHWLATQGEIGFLYQQDGQSVGFMNLSIRKDYVNGTDTSPVAFVEAIYILPEYRKLGFGGELVEYAEEFARDNGMTQLASDCLIDNSVSEAFHKSCGFVEKERVICFVKDIDS